MVASRLVEFPEDIVDETEVDLPPMMFVEGEEPVGVRVLTYQSSRAINTIINALNEEEIQYLRESSFGKLVEIAEKPAFSAWFRFVGKPIRFSLREFSIVTGLHCGEIPKKPKLKKKKNINDKPYWLELFGSMEEMRVSTAVKMLRKKNESESDDDEIEYPVRKAKKKTLSPAHTREVDKKPEVVVKSIIPQDPQRPVDESVFVWTDEVFDKKVENLVKLICDNFVFAKDMFKGGVTKAEVDKMREESKVIGKKKKTRAKETQNVEPDEDKIARLDGNLSAGLASMKELASSSLQYKDYVLATVSEMMKQMKSDILGSVGDGNAHVHVEGQHITPSTGNNAKTIGNVLEHLSHCSTPLDLQNMVSKEPLMHHVADLSSPAPVGDITHQMSNVSGHSQTHDSPRSAIPSFSLGLTQEIDAPNRGEDEEMGENETEPGLVREEDTLICRKSKRLRTVPPYLLTGYQCGSAILNRAREGQLCGDRYYEMSDIREKYVCLSTILTRPW
ncbi:hypothetical protein Bca4012_041684 [Brassica carinata]|uniref:DUF1985 domain-containing protein n=1 Tax=Brassica carinata TaxID=52824 RepID=A0A8X7QWA9_BRACI|nr:hypothetical protein Bca52824_060543 [Brassica carinata]